DVTKQVLPGMRLRRQGHIFNVSSLGGLVAFAATVYYHATKFAVEALSESLSHELRPLVIDVTILELGAYLGIVDLFDRREVTVAGIV
ncbi:SDR family NAD(P)-dependent oxidoreductase, partial [Rhizobium ruizarguesonis]